MEWLASLWRNEMSSPWLFIRGCEETSGRRPTPHASTVNRRVSQHLPREGRPICAKLRGVWWPLQDKMGLAQLQSLILPWPRKDCREAYTSASFFLFSLAYPLLCPRARSPTFSTAHTNSTFSADIYARMLHDTPIGSRSSSEEQECQSMG